jgi:shikimate dehydrogenase
MLDSKTKLYGVIGNPIAHSLSPVLQNWMIKSFGLNAVYLAFCVQQDELKSCIDGLKALEIGGLNVTIPHKEKVLDFVDEKSETVMRFNACNTLQNKNGRICAHVTDPFGFIESLAEHRAHFAGAHVVLIGAGGAARSVTFALAQLGVKRLYNTDVLFDRALHLSHLAVKNLHIPEALVIQHKDPVMNDAIVDSTIIINASPVGMHPDTGCPLTDMSAFSTRHFVYDLVYNPGTTRFLSQAHAKGAAIQNGLDMLIFQGLGSLRIWENKELLLNGPALMEVRNVLKGELQNHG